MRWLLKRWWFWAGTGLILVAIVAGYVLIPLDQGRINQANFDRIQVGMTFAEVKSLLGDDYWGTAEHGDPPWWRWFDDKEGWLNGDEIWVTFKSISHQQDMDVHAYYGQLEVIKKEYHRTKRPLHDRLKRRMVRRIRALWP